MPEATTIGDDAFSNCKSLKEIELPQATTVGNKAFYNCTALTSVNLPQATALGDDVFTECTALNTIKLIAEGSISVQNSTFGPADTITKNVDLTLNINKKEKHGMSSGKKKNGKTINGKAFLLLNKL